MAAAIQQDDFLSAARVLDQKLDSHDEALEQLLHGWHSLQQKQCIGEAFRLWGRLGRHEEADVQLGRLQGPEYAPATYRNFIDALAEIAHTYPDPLVRASTADTVRVMAATRLKGAIPDESQRLLAAVRRLAPEDRLLERDCQRYLGQTPRVVRQAPPAVRHPARIAVLVKKHRVADMLQCFTAAASGDCFYIAGYGPGDSLSVVRGYWIDVNRKAAVSWALGGAAWHAPVILVPDWTSRIPASLPLFIVHLLNVAQANLMQKAFPGRRHRPLFRRGGKSPLGNGKYIGHRRGGQRHGLGAQPVLWRTRAGWILSERGPRGVAAGRIASRPGRAGRESAGVAASDAGS